MIVIAVAAEAIALYYQYVLDQYPCVLCIHVRIWVFAFIVIGAVGLFAHRNLTALRVVNLLSVIASVGFVERSWRTLATERGWIVELACSMEAGLPAWFELDAWFPAVFGVQVSCGVTPEMLFGITMAEALMVMSAGTLIVTALVLIASLLRSS